MSDGRGESRTDQQPHNLFLRVPNELMEWIREQAANPRFRSMTGYLLNLVIDDRRRRRQFKNL